MLELVLPNVARRAAWQESHREWGPGQHEDGFGVGPNDEVDSVEGFGAWVDWLHSRPGHLWWIVDEDAVLGGIVLRAHTDDWVQRVGHIGYGIRPSARGRGVATWALDQVLKRAGNLGLAQVLLVCRDENLASRKTIERCGGVLEQIVDDGRGLARRYWINLTDRRSVDVAWENP
ncbi:GNAT family N-acetyltransferase [Leekyejoonella antrihumi]|uniref:GNAT family N-acetyltransferase n=1 Tax=Leekyejoonella antrihumi TaxID=1660198 RepID=A0A563E7B7_9MICO|nr:GNAT family N-acetyltransferase [Leekyejoonella antrihumi]TWP38315.1 GNAT family N-acetyltransferase [Leekyejoonella antrihumi]